MRRLIGHTILRGTRWALRVFLGLRVPAQRDWRA